MKKVYHKPLIFIVFFVFEPYFLPFFHIIFIILLNFLWDSTYVLLIEVMKMPMVFFENFLKKTNLAQVTEEDVNEALCLMNHRPRKCLGWKISWVTYPRSGIHL